MKKFCQVFLAFLMVLNLFVFCSFTSNAAGTTTMFLSSNSPKVGDTLKLTVTGSASSTITVKYNATILVFQNCDVSGYTQSGNSVSFTGKSGNINFSIAEAGDANIIVSSNSLAGCSTQIKVTGSSDTSVSNQTTTENTQETVVEDVDTEADPSAEESLPADETVQGLGDANHHVTVMSPDTLLNDSMVETTYTTDADTYTLYQFSGVANEFYYVYGENEQGLVGWYVFDSSTGQVYRADTAVLSLIGDGDGSTATDKSEFSEYVDYAKDYVKDNYRNILAIAILLIAVIVVIRINIRAFRKASDDEKEDDGSDIFADLDSPKKGSIFSRFHDEDEDDEEDEEDDDDDEDEDEDEVEDKTHEKKEKEADVEIPSLDLSVVNEVLEEEKDEENVKDEPKKEFSSHVNREINLMDLNNL